MPVERNSLGFIQQEEGVIHWHGLPLRPPQSKGACCLNFYSICLEVKFQASSTIQAPPKMPRGL